jgi:hypothetical protein
MINGFQVSQAISVAATLSIPDLLRYGARDCSALAKASGSHERSLYRLLRTLAAVGVLDEKPDRRFSLTLLGEHLRSDVLSSQSVWARLLGRPMYYRAWSGLLDSIRTGEIAFNKVHGISVWDFRAQRPEETAAFDNAMATITDRVAEAVLLAYDFGHYTTVIDIGGGHGAFIARILRAYPALRGILFDQPHVVEHAKCSSPLSAVIDRCEIVGGNFFESVPANADAYLLKWIVHDWNDNDAVSILKSCRRAIGPGGTLIVVECLIGECNEGVEGKLMDLNMMVITGGVERTREEYASILEAAGFRLARIVPTPTLINVIEAIPV